MWLLDMSEGKMVIGVSVLLLCDGSCLGNSFQTFQSKIMSSYSVVQRYKVSFTSLKMWAVFSFEMSGTLYPVT